MATDFPTSKQTIPNPTSTDLLENASATLDHDYQHSTANDTVEALQDKVGIDGDSTTSSHDYKLSGVTGSDKAASLTGAETLTNKTIGSGAKTALGSDAEGDMYVRDSGGNLTRLAIGSDDQILTSDGTNPVWETNPATTDASETERGVVEKATQAEVDAGTATGGAGTLVATPDTVRAKKYHDYALSTGSSNAYVLDVSPSITAYATGQEFTFEANHSNTGTATLNVDTLGAKTLKDPEGTEMSSGWIQSGGIYKVVYDGTDMIVVSPLNKTMQVDQDTYNVSNGTGQTSTTITVGFTPKIVHYVIECADADEEAIAWGQYDVDADTYASINLEPSSNNTNIRTADACNANFTDGQFTVSFDTFTSTGFDITVDRDSTFASNGTIRVTSVR